VYENSSDHRQFGVRRVQSASYRTALTSDNRERHNNINNNNNVEVAHYDPVRVGLVMSVRLLPKRPHTSVDRRRPPLAASSKARDDDPLERRYRLHEMIDSVVRLPTDRSRTVPVIMVTGVPLQLHQWKRNTSKTSARRCDRILPTVPRSWVKGRLGQLPPLSHHPRWRR